MIERKFPKEWSEYKEVVDRLKLMLDKPEEGLMSWNYMTMALFDQLSTMWNGAPVKDLMKDAFDAGFTAGLGADYGGYMMYSSDEAYQKWLQKQK